VNRALRAIAFLFAAIYFAVDALFLSIARPIAKWLSHLRLFDKLRNWILSLRPYPALLLFAVPVILLEPVKPIALYLAGTGHVVMGATVFVGGELAKLVFIERLFSLTCEKLITIPAFAWAYQKYRYFKARITSSAAWRTVRRFSLIARYTIRNFVLEIANKQRRVFVQLR
jgi:hypothetical protein